MLEVPLLLLAAGAATRMGQPKQLLPYRGIPLVRHCAEQALASICHPVVVILGAHADRVRPALAGLPLRIQENPRWEIGLGASLHAGLSALDLGRANGVILALADQPQVGPDTFNGLVEDHLARGHALVASEYAETVGVPVFVGRHLFPHLRSLDPRSGGKQLLLQFGRHLASRPCPEAALDIDTPEDYQRLLGTSPSAHGRVQAPVPTTPPRP